MKKVMVIYWTGSGNTEHMANLIAEGAKAAGADATAAHVSSVSADDVVTADAVALGSPSMGVEVIEESEMEPFVESLSGVVEGKKMVLFGSYGWGDGQWLRDWTDRMTGYGVVMVEEAFGVPGAAAGADEEKCREIGKKLAEA